MSLGCTPQTGKVLKYNSSVNNQLAHQNCSTDTRQIRQQNCPGIEDKKAQLRTCTGCKLRSTEAYYCVHGPAVHSVVVTDVKATHHAVGEEVSGVDVTTDA